MFYYCDLFCCRGASAVTTNGRAAPLCSLRPRYMYKPTRNYRAPLLYCYHRRKRSIYNESNCCASSSLSIWRKNLGNFLYTEKNKKPLINLCNLRRLIVPPRRTKKESELVCIIRRKHLGIFCLQPETAVVDRPLARSLHSVYFAGAMVA